ncbi:MAG: 4Fe-4S binding protein [Candidatus Hodarchaeota archaeon]
MEHQDVVYHELRKQIDKMPVGIPPTDSGVEIRILKHLFTPEQAKIALFLNVIPEALDRIYNRIRKNYIAISLEELENILSYLARTGRILGSEKNGVKSYSYLPFAIGMYEFQVDQLTREFYKDCEEFILTDFMHEYARTGIPQLRTIPISKSIQHDLNVSSYDHLRQFIKGLEGKFGVRDCICRQGKDLIGEPCQVADFRDTCLSLPMDSLGGKGSRFLLEPPESYRSITKDEALEILQRAENTGLVIQPANVQRPNFVCCCCGDCCGVLTAAKTFPKPAKVFATNFYASIDPHRCKGCGLCVDRCQMDALTLIEDKASVDLDRCIGCGLCVVVCSTAAVQLKKKNKELKPPTSLFNLYRKIMIKKHGKFGTLKLGAKILLKRKI